MPFSAPELAPTPALESTIPIRGIAGAADAELPVVGEMPADADLGTDAARAVEAVFTAAELARQGERSSVTLRFALGEADLSVRVAVRDQQVHATFVTDSAELRAVLAQECSAVSAEPGRAYRFSADITGAGGDSAGFMSSGDDSAAGRREDRRDTAGAAFAGWRTRPLATGPAGAAPHPGVRANSVHLHTLA